MNIGLVLFIILLSVVGFFFLWNIIIGPALRKTRHPDNDGQSGK